MTVRRFVRLLSMVAASLLPALAVAQAFPNAPLRLVVGYPPGGGTDTTARVVAQKLGETLGQQVVVENKPGATGIIAAQYVAKAKPDGYTLLMLTANDTALPALNAQLPFDLVRDFTPVSLLTIGPMVLVVNPTLPVANIQELITMGRTRTLTFGSSGIGGAPHLAGELFGSMAKTKQLHVPYKGGGDLVTAVMSGQIDMCFTSVASAVGLIESGKLKALAVSSAKRVPALPGVPSLDESGLTGYNYSSWYGIVAPAGVPAAIVAHLQEHIARAIANAEIGNSLNKQGFVPQSNTPAQFAAMIEREIALNASLAKQAGVQPQ